MMKMGIWKFAGLVALIVIIGIGAIWFYFVHIQPTAFPTEGLLGEGVVGDDADGDGLTDLLESAYGTNKDNPDTDGDGSLDGEEVDTYRDPTTPGPGDALSPEESFFGPAAGRSYTQQYLATLPADLPKEQMLEEARVQAFVESVAEPLLPEIPEESLRVFSAQEEAAATSMRAYLDAISPATNGRLREVTTVDISQAFHLHYINHSSQALDAIAHAAATNVTVLEAVVVPAEVVGLHRKLLAAHTALRDNVRLLQEMPNDFIGGLVGAYRIRQLGDVFGEIAQEVARF